ncbi:MAG: hypothetical protein GY814_05740 [Gammaproteobacteria bacterium]|nr:hypothetical protein [Gammaproteobacteria bacterium]
MYNLLLALHLLGTVVWVGGMFFAHMAMRQAANELLEPPLRLPFLKRVLDRFFTWVWLAVVLILASGYWIFLVLFNGQAGLYVHLMQGVGLVMVVLFCFIYFAPYQRMGLALERQDIPAAAAQMAIIRKVIGVNLILGLVTTVIAVSKYV